MQTRIVGLVARTASLQVTGSSRPAGLLVLAMCVPAVGLSAQSVWTQLSGANPPPRSHHAMVYDAARDRVVLFGGRHPQAGPLADTWEWDGTGWSQVFTPIAPPARVAHAMAYDSVRRVTVLFGGGANLDDTWEYEGTNWQPRVTATQPAGRTAHGLAFDPVGGGVLLYAGWNGATTFSDTWRWDGLAWQALSPQTVPGIREGHSMAADPVRGRIVMWGGWHSQASEVWEWNGFDWQSTAATPGPGWRAYQCLAYDPVAQRTLMFGGGSYAGLHSDIWEWDGQSWTASSMVSGPSGRTGTAMAMDGHRHRMLVFGGDANPMDGETWTYTTSVLASATPFGFGCAGADGIPRLDQVPGALPRIGAVSVQVLHSIGYSPTANLPLFVVGGSRSSWSGGTLPFPLAGQGMPGCFLWVDPIASRLGWNQGGFATNALAVPAAPSMVGLQLYCQGMVGSPGANPAGAVVSNAVSLRIGW